MQAGTRFTYPGGMEGWVDPTDLIALRPGVELVTFQSRVRHPTTAPPRQQNSHALANKKNMKAEEVKCKDKSIDSVTYATLKGDCLWSVGDMLIFLSKPPIP